MSDPHARVRAGASARRHFTVAVLAREILRDAALVLHASGIPVMPLKGVLFQLLLYADPSERLVSDVDVLVPEGDFSRAVQALCAAGFQLQKVGRSLIEVALLSPRGLAIDLHRSLFSPARYALHGAQLFQRASRDERLLGVPLQIAHPHDTAAHLIGKFVSDHVVDQSVPRLAELARWCAHYELQPALLARHLDAAGMGRAARYTLGRGAELLGDAFFLDTLAALPPDPVGQLCARAARALMPRWQGTPLAAAPAHLLNSSLARAGSSAVWVGVNRLRHPGVTARLARAASSRVVGGPSARPARG